MFSISVGFWPNLNKTDILAWIWVWCHGRIWSLYFFFLLFF